MKVCAVIALREDTRNRIATALRSLGMEPISLGALAELPPMLSQVPVSGILLEVLASLKASPLDKENTQELLDFYPFAKFRVQGSSVLVLGQGDSLEEFVGNCQRFKPRCIRREPRKAMHRAVLLSADDNFSTAEQTVTINVSEGGCFVYSVKEWNEGGPVWLRLPGSAGTLNGKVRSRLTWGNDRYIPGIGIELEAKWSGFDWAGGASPNPGYAAL